ncbi:MAG: hypothetical protein ACLR0N_17730 [Bilophila wadsworthia]
MTWQRLVCWTAGDLTGDAFRQRGNFSGKGIVGDDLVEGDAQGLCASRYVAGRQQEAAPRPPDGAALGAANPAVMPGPTSGGRSGPFRMRCGYRGRRASSQPPPRAKPGIMAMEGWRRASI